MEKTWFMARMELDPNAKVIMSPMEYIPMEYKPNAKDMVSSNIFFSKWES